MTEIEITTAAEAGNAEPRLTLTELQSLLRDAAALERAQRPIVIRSSTESAASAATPGYGPPRHPGIDVTVPAAPEVGVGWAVLRHRAPQAPGWGVRAACVSMLLSLAGSATAAASHGNAAAVAVAAAGLLGVVGGVAQAVTEQNREA